MLRPLPRAPAVQEEGDFPDAFAIFRLNRSPGASVFVKGAAAASYPAKELEELIVRVLDALEKHRELSEIVQTSVRD